MTRSLSPAPGPKPEPENRDLELRQILALADWRAAWLSFKAGSDSESESACIWWRLPGGQSGWGTTRLSMHLTVRWIFQGRGLIS